MTTFKRTTGFLALAACLLAAGCGSDDEGAGIPRNSAAALENQLDSIQDRFEFPGGAACADITDGDDPNTTAVQRRIDGLPADVDADVRDALQQGFDRLFQLVEEQCKKPQTETQTDTVTEQAPPPPETETETETTPPPTTETTPPPTETTEPPATDTEQQATPGQGGNAPGAEGGSGEGGQGGDAGGGQGGSGGGALVPGDEG